jgi:hypothetical protein
VVGAAGTYSTMAQATTLAGALEAGTEQTDTAAVFRFWGRSSYRYRGFLPFGLRGNTAGSLVHGSKMVGPECRVSFTLRVTR